MRLNSRLSTSLFVALLLFSGLFSGPAQGAQSCRGVFNPIANETLRLSVVRPISAAAIAKRPLNTVREIKVLQYNVENLFMSVGKHELLPTNTSFKRVSDAEEKPEWQLEGVSKPMLEFDPDLMVLEEVESLDALVQFNSDYLASAYRPLLVQGNDERGINIGFYVKKDLPLDITVESHKDATWTDPTDHQQHKLFSRDVPAVIVRREGETGTPLLIVLGNHAKSKRDRNGDPLSETLRAAQYKEIGNIIDGYRAQYGKDVPLMIAGDFNTEVTSSSSVKPVRDRMVDAFDMKGLRGIERVTHSFHPNGGRAEYNQIDAVFVSPSLSKSISTASVYRYKDQNGREKPLPRTYDERSKNPSDHYPVMVTVTTERIFPEAYGAQMPVPAPAPRQRPGRPAPRVASGF